MSQEADSILERLEKGVSAWKAELQEGCKRLEQQLQTLKERLETRPAQDIGDDRLAQAVEERDRALEEAASLRAELERMRAGSVPKDEVDRLNQLIEEAARRQDEMVRELVGAKAALEEAKAALESQEDTTELRQELAEALRQRDEARADAKAVRQQLDRLRQSSERAAEPAPAERASFSPTDPDGNRLRIGDILYQAGLINKKQLNDALMAQVGAPHRKLGDILIEKGYTGEDVIAQVLAAQLGVPFIRIADEAPTAEAVRMLNPRVARMHQCLPLRATDREIVVAMSNPLDLIAIDDVELASGKRVSVVVASRTELSEAIEQQYGTQAGAWF